MTVTCMEILGYDGENRPILSLPRRRKDALAEFCRRVFAGPGRRKAVMGEWCLSNDEARSVIEGTSSEATWEKIKQHPRGGWKVAAVVEGAVIGHAYEDFLTSLAEEHARAAARATARTDHLRSLEARASLALRSLDRPKDDGLRGALGRPGDAADRVGQPEA